MSPALNHVRGLSGVPSLRATHSLGHRWRQAYCRDKRLIARRPSCPLRNTPRGAHRSFGTKACLSYPESLSSRLNDNCRSHSNENSSSLSQTSRPSISQAPEPPDTLKLNTKQRGPKNAPELSRYKRGKRRELKQIPTPSEYLSKTLQKHVFGRGEQSSLRTFNHGARVTYGRPLQTVSLQSILAEYIRLVDPLLSGSSSHATLSEVGNNLDAALIRVFKPDTYHYLNARGYDVEDVVSWAWVLKSPTARQAVSRMFVLEADGATRHGPGVPIFIPIFLLKEHHLDARSFRLLLVHSLHLMSGHRLPAASLLQRIPPNTIEELPLGKSPARITLGTCVIIVDRLVRHARQVWPRALPTIATVFARFLTRPYSEKTKISNLDRQKIDRGSTNIFNTCLWLLSLPTKVNPFRSASIQQQAQFELLKSMASHKPVLPLSRKGYQSIVAVQLAHKKTEAERQSAELKSPSWPPWKEEKLGMDAQRGNDGLRSRAMNVLSQMAEAGYSHQVWEKASTILAGWDTDRSPTIQTRTLVHPTGTLFKPDTDEPDLSTAVWVARIRATRTIREAWACFLAYQDQGLPPESAIYVEMIVKLIYRQVAIRRRFDETKHALPGDGPEVHAEPASARDVIYVRTEPPTVEHLLAEMFSHGFRPSGKFLALLLRTAPNLRTGLEYLRRSDLAKTQLAALCVIWGQPSQCPVPYVKALGSIPDGVFLSFIKLMCTHSKSIRKRMGSKEVLSPNDFPALTENTQVCEPLAALSDFQEDMGQWKHPRTLWHAVQLVKLRQPPSHAAWVHILDTMSVERVSKKHTDRTRCLYRIIGWHETLAVLQWMKHRNVDPGSQGFKALCIAFKKAVDAGMRYPGVSDEASSLIQRAAHGDEYANPEPEHELDTFNPMVETGLQILKAEFERLVLPASGMPDLAEQSIFVAGNTDESQPCIPQGLHVPSFVTLHSFVGALGMAGDDEALLHLLRWMSHSAAELGEASMERQNGNKNIRLTLVAIRMYLEQLRSDSNVQEAFKIISQTPGWEWPSDEEVEGYGAGLYK